MRLTSAALVTAVALVAGAPTTRAAAQQTPARPVRSAVGSVAGVVTNVATGDPLRAEISIDRPRKSVRADSAGRFAFHGIPSGRVRRRAESEQALMELRGAAHLRR